MTELPSPRPAGTPRGRKPGLRSRGREAALKFLYGCDLRDQRAMGDFDDFIGQQGLRGPEVAFARELANGVLAHWDEIDARLGALSENWKLGRMAVVDRNVLRIGIYELAHVRETPPTVVINEAVELAKRYGAKESGAFVNGILDRVRLEIAESPRPHPEEE